MNPNPNPAPRAPPKTDTAATARRTTRDYDSFRRREQTMPRPPRNASFRCPSNSLLWANTFVFRPGDVNLIRADSLQMRTIPVNATATPIRTPLIKSNGAVSNRASSHQPAMAPTAMLAAYEPSDHREPDQRGRNARQTLLTGMPIGITV